MKNKKISENLQIVAIIMMLIIAILSFLNIIYVILTLSIITNLIYYLSIQKAI